MEQAAVSSKLWWVWLGRTLVNGGSGASHKIGCAGLFQAPSTSGSLARALMVLRLSLLEAVLCWPTGRSDASTASVSHGMQNMYRAGLANPFRTAPIFLRTTFLGIFLGFSWDFLRNFVGFSWDFLRIFLGFSWICFAVVKGLSSSRLRSQVPHRRPTAGTFREGVGLLAEDAPREGGLREVLLGKRTIVDVWRRGGVRHRRSPDVPYVSAARFEPRGCGRADIAPQGKAIGVSCSLRVSPTHSSVRRSRYKKPFSMRWRRATPCT